MRTFWISAALLVSVASAPLVAQDYRSDQAAADELRHAIERLARTPTDSDALLDAGNAALILRDYDSALGFFTRAEALQPSSGRIKAGLATAQLYNENPVEALKLYDQAIALGVAERSIAPDRGLAFDLVGNNALAQSEYALGSTAVTTEDLIVRQAVSYGLAGDQKRADALLNPLLSQNKPTAWRARAFILAAQGDVEEATRIVRGFLDARSTEAMQSYLERMSQLTKAQQAAVIHYGHFPSDQQVGRDSEAVRAIASRGYAARAATASQDRGLIPAGEPLGRREKVKPDSSVSRRQARAQRASIDRSARATRRAGVRASDAPAQGQVAVAQAAAPPAVQTASAVPVTSVPDAAQGGAVASSAPQGELPAISAPVAVDTQIASAAAAAANDSAASDVATGPALAQAEAPNAVGPGFETLGDPAALEQFTAAQRVSTAPAATLGTVPAERNAVMVASIADDVPTGAAAGNGSPVDVASVSAVPVSAAAVSARTVATVDAAPGPSSSDAVPSLGAIVRSISIPPQEQQRNVFAVDLERLEQYKNAKPLGPAPDPVKSPFASVKAVPEGAKPLDSVGRKPKKSAKAATPPKAAAAPVKESPARFWVQIATGASGAMKNEFRRLGRGKTELFKGQKGWTSPFKAQQRLLVGPFDTLGDARGWLTKYEEAGGEGFAWNSGAGTAVDPLP